MKDRSLTYYLIAFTLLTCQLLYYPTAVSSDCQVKSENDHDRMLSKRLQPLKGKHFKVKEDHEGTREVYDFYLGVCTEPEVPTDVNVTDGVGMIQTITRKDDKSKHVVGISEHVVGCYNQTQLMGGDGWILLKYMGGDVYHTHCVSQNQSNQHRQAFIMITCGQSLMGHLTKLEENTDQGEECYYLFQLESSVACTPQDGLSAGSIFCIVLLTTVGLYLLIGFLHQRIVVGAKGLEQIPNYNLWKEFGKLQADGCDFLCRCGERQEAKMYRGIDDQLLNPDSRDERDDRLLPM